MTFDELIDAVHGLPGRMVHASVKVPDDGNPTLVVSSFSGIVKEIQRGGAVNMAEHWYIWWEKDGSPKPDHGTVILQRDVFESARVKGTEIAFEDAMDQGQTMGEWAIEVRQSGIIIELLAYIWAE